MLVHVGTKVCVPKELQQFDQLRAEQSQRMRRTQEAGGRRMTKAAISVGVSRGPVAFSKVRHFFENHRQHIVYLLIFYSACLIVFFERFFCKVLRSTTTNIYFLRIFMSSFLVFRLLSSERRPWFPKHSRGRCQSDARRGWRNQFHVFAAFVDDVSQHDHAAERHLPQPLHPLRLTRDLPQGRRLHRPLLQR